MLLGAQKTLCEHHETSKASTGRMGMNCSAYKQNYSCNLRQNWISMRQALDETQRLNYICRLRISLKMSNHWEKGKTKKFLLSVFPVLPNSYASFVQSVSLKPFSNKPPYHLPWDRESHSERIPMLNEDSLQILQGLQLGWVWSTLHSHSDSCMAHISSRLHFWLPESSQSQGIYGNSCQLKHDKTKINFSN